MNEDKKKEFLAKAKEIMAKKNKLSSYLTEGVCYKGKGDYSTSVYFELVDEDRDLLRSELKKKQLSEIEEDFPLYDVLFCELEDGPFTPESIDLDHPHHFYKFSIVMMDSLMDDEPSKYGLPILVNDDDYTALLAWRLEHPDDGFNFLHSELPELFHRLTWEINFRISTYQLGTAPYLVFMDEVDEDCTYTE